jgi:hypothetical protein
VAGRRRCPWFIVDRTERKADVKSLTKNAQLKSMVRQYLAKRSRHRRLGTADALPHRSGSAGPSDGLEGIEPIHVTLYVAQRTR